MRHRRSEQMATEERRRQVLKLLGRSAYRQARFFAQELPGKGRTGFPRQAVDAFYLWEEFEYGGAARM